MTLIYLGVGATGVELWICVRVEKLELPCEVRHSPGAAAPRVVRPKAIPLRGDRDHDAFALWVLSSSERAVCNSSLRMSQKGRASLHSGDGRDRTPTCDRWHVRVVVLVMPKEVEANHGIPGRNQS